MLKSILKPRIDEVGGYYFFRCVYTNLDIGEGVGFPVWLGKPAPEEPSTSKERAGFFESWNVASRWVEDNKAQLGPDLVKALKDYMKTVHKVEDYQMNAGDAANSSVAPSRKVLQKFGGIWTMEEYLDAYKSNKTGSISAKELYQEREVVKESQRIAKEANEEEEEKKPKNPNFWKTIVERMDPQSLNAITIATVPDLQFYHCQTAEVSDEYIKEMKEATKLPLLTTPCPEVLERLEYVQGPNLKSKKAKALLKKCSIPKDAGKKAQAKKSKAKGSLSTLSRPKA